MTHRRPHPSLILLAASACTSFRFVGTSGTTSDSSSSDAQDITTSGSSEPTGAGEAGETSATTGDGCTISAECFDPTTPVCTGTTCVPCTEDAECAAKDPGSSLCRDDGACVACTPTNPSLCKDATPVCNAGSGACEGCRFHGQCPSAACDIASGACFDEDCVVEVDGDGGADYQSIADAAVDSCVVIVHELDGSAGYVEAVVVDGVTVALLAAEGERPLLVGADGRPALDVDGGTVYVQGLTLRGDVGAQGIVANAGNLYLDQTRVHGDAADALRLAADSDAQLRNCFVGGDGEGVDALEVSSSRVDIVYSTLGAGFGDASAVRCDPASMVRARNSLLVATSSGPEVDCTGAGATLETSVTEAEVGDVNTNWFVAGGYANGDFHLTGLAPFTILIAAQWREGDPSSDIDGDPRIAEDGMAGAVGADTP